MYTREQDKYTQDLERRVSVLQQKQNDIQVKLNSIIEMLKKVDGSIFDVGEGALTVSDVKKIVKRMDVKQHDHTSSVEGGECFAALGSNLVSN